MKKLRKIIVLLAVWILFTVILLEVSLRVMVTALPYNLQTTVRRVTSGQPFAETWTPAWQYNRDHFMALRPDLDNALQYGTPSVQFHVSTINLWDLGIGFRTRPIDYYVDAIVVGDSFSFCFTEREDCWVTLLEQATGLGLVNLGQWGTGSVSHMRHIATYAPPLEPRLVIWQFYGNDFNDDYGLAAWRGDIAEIPDDFSDIELDVPDVFPSWPIIIWLRENSALFAVFEVLATGRWGGLNQVERDLFYVHSVDYEGGTLQFGRNYDLQAFDMTRLRNQKGLSLARDAFQQAKDIVSRWGGEIVVVIIPSREEVYDHLTVPVMGQAAIDKVTSSRDAMWDLCSELDLRCYDPLADLRQYARSGEHLFYSDDLHLNPRGNAVFAALVADWLDEEGLLTEP